MQTEVQGIGELPEEHIALAPIDNRMRCIDPAGSGISMKSLDHTRLVSRRSNPLKRSDRSFELRIGFAGAWAKRGTL